jgi:hypothetical protein
MWQLTMAKRRYGSKASFPVPPGDVGCQLNNDLDSELPAGR